MRGLVPRKVRSEGVVKLKLVPGTRGKIRGGIGIVKLEWVQVMCPACGQRVEAVVADGRIKGYCAVARETACQVLRAFQILMNVLGFSIQTPVVLQGSFQDATCRLYLVRSALGEARGI